MERNAITELEQLTLNSSAKSFLKETAKWAFFLSIMGFIGIGFIVIVALFAGTIFNSIPEYQQMPFNMGPMITAIYLVIAVVYFFPVYYLLQFSNKMKDALASKDDATLATAFEKLKSHYKFVGVFTIIILSLYALIFVFAIVGALAI